MIEEWRPIPGYEPWYEVSNLGRIKVLAYEFESIRGKTRCIIHRPDKILNPTIARSVGCRMCTLTNRCTGRSNYSKIYHIVAKVFNGMEPEVVIHKNGDMSNDCATNLVHKFNQNDNADESWLPIPGYEGLYEISNLGRVRSLGRLASHGASHAIRKPAKLLKYSVDDDGYFGVGLSDSDGHCKQFRINRLVASTFIPNPNNLPVVNHIDGNKQNNNVKNLEWCTVKHNTFEAYRMGLNPVSNPKPVVCLTNGMRFESIQAAADWVGCDHVNISQSINMHSCCKGGYCFVFENDYPEDTVQYKAQAEASYAQRIKPNFHCEVKCLDTGEMFYSIAECARSVEGNDEYLLECISNHRLFHGRCYVRVRDLESNGWDESAYCDWVHNLHEANKHRDSERISQLANYGVIHFDVNINK